MKRDTSRTPSPDDMRDARQRVDFLEWAREHQPPLQRHALLTLDGASQRTGLPKRTIRSLSDSGRLAYVTAGGTKDTAKNRTATGRGPLRHWRLYRVADLDRLIVEHPAR